MNWSDRNPTPAPPLHRPRRERADWALFVMVALIALGLFVFVVVLV